MSETFTVVEDGNIPEWLQEAYQDGKTIQVMSSIGWITLDDGDVEFRNTSTYRVKP
jgi:hypothetical protein